MTASAPAQPASVPTPHRSLLGRHPLVFFFLIAFAATWLLEIPLALSQTGTGLLPFSLPLPAVALTIAAATFVGPTVAAFIMTGITEGRAGVRRLLRRYVLWRVGLRWYVFVSDYERVEVLCKSAPDAISELVNWGARFHREQDGRLTQRFFGAHTYRRTVFYEDWTGQEIIRVLMKQVIKSGRSRL